MTVQLQKALQNLKKGGKLENGIQYWQTKICPKELETTWALYFLLHTSQLHGCCLEAIDTMTKYVGVNLSKDFSRTIIWETSQKRQIRRRDSSCETWNIVPQPRGLQLNTPHQNGAVIEATRLCSLKWFGGEQLVGSCHVVIARTLCLICLIALYWKTLQYHRTIAWISCLLYKFRNDLAKGDNAELHLVAYSSTRSSGHAFKLPVIKYDFYEFSKST